MRNGETHHDSPENQPARSLHVPISEPEGREVLSKRGDLLGREALDSTGLDVDTDLDRNVVGGEQSEDLVTYLGDVPHRTCWVNVLRAMESGGPGGR